MTNGNNLMEEVNIKLAFDKFKPESCVFVISVDEAGKPNGMIAGWQMKCSYNPPLIAVAIGNTRNTKKMIDTSKEFVIAVPNTQLIDAVNFFGNNSGKNVDKFKETNIITMPAKITKTPLLTDATVNYECTLYSSLPVGDHHIYVGHVLHAYINDTKDVLFNLYKKSGKRYFGKFNF